MGILHADIDRQGTHTAHVQLSWHRHTPGGIELGPNEAGGVLQFGHVDPVTQNQRLVFVKFLQSVPEGFSRFSSEKQEHHFSNEVQLMGHSLNNLFKAEAQGMRSEMSPFHHFVLDHKPDIVFVEPFATPQFRQLSKKEMTGQERIGNIVTALSAGAGLFGVGAATRHHQRNVDAAQKLGRRKAEKSAGISRRRFLWAGGISLLAAAAGVVGGRHIHPDMSLMDWQVTRPGDVEGIRQVYASAIGSMADSQSTIRLRNVLSAEKIARMTRKVLGKKYNEVGVVWGLGHEKIAHYLENPEERRTAIASIPHLDQLIHEPLSERVIHFSFNHQKGRYEPIIHQVGFR